MIHVKPAKCLIQNRLKILHFGHRTFVFKIFSLIKRYLQEHQGKRNVFFIYLTISLSIKQEHYFLKSFGHTLSVFFQSFHNLHT